MRQLIKPFLFSALFCLPVGSLMAQESELQLLHVQGQVYMLSGAGVNVTVQLGSQGIVFVDSPDEDIVPAMMELIRQHSNLPVLFVASTALDEEHISSNAILGGLGDAAGATAGGRGQQVTAIAGSGNGVTLLAHENVLNRFYLTDHNIPRLDLTSTYYTGSKDISLNQEPVVIYHVANAHTDGDSIVYFRRSDVISTGDIYTPGRYPVIDIERGGSVQGLIEALNFLIELIVPGPMAEAGTYVIPGHGRIGDEIDVVEYRNMVYIVMQRVEALIADGMNLRQIIAARPTLDYDTEYGGRRGGASNEEFITAIYNSLTAEM
jgi:cyclase